MTARSDGRNAVWPPPIYVATLANGATVRMSFYSRRGKPLDFERGRRVCSNLASQRASRAIAGHVELLNMSGSGVAQTLPDPHFAKVVPMVAKAKPPKHERSPAILAMPPAALLLLLLRASDAAREGNHALVVKLAREVLALTLGPVDEPHPESIPVHYPRAWKR